MKLQSTRQSHRLGGLRLYSFTAEVATNQRQSTRAGTGGSRGEAIPKKLKKQKGAASTATPLRLTHSGFSARRVKHTQRLAKAWDMLALPFGPSRQEKGDRVAGFLFRMETADGAPAEPPSITTAVPNWRSGDTIPLGHGTLRVVGRRDDEAAGGRGWGMNRIDPTSSFPT